MPRLPAQPNQSLLDGLTVIQTLAGKHARHGIGSRQLARELGFDPTRTNRLLKTLAAIGVANQRADDRRYFPGPAMHVLAANAMHGSGLLARATTPLESLRQLDSPTIALGVLWNNSVSYLIHALPDQPFAQGIARLSNYPAHESSIGLVLAAHQPTPPKWPGVTASLLKQIRQQGFVDLSRQNGRYSIAIALSHDDAAIAVAGEFTARQLPQIIARLKSVALQIDSAHPLNTHAH
jgi:hypothetical protein